ncbi:DUF3847 domain-containing protein [Ezakiella coagulans]|uniref:DUF3847 domain-containing protein n=1 Tax=Ezakiella coagulans TaxID=46507 RepID=UPI002014F170|nr:DUF3847 domain-containing protein [Ezakiella coagulans]UQK61653.1 DUF3847 domain-containing protein [Ezakiella coagulans]
MKKGVLYEKIKQLRQESKERKDKINDTEERLRQLKNQEKKILKQDIVKRRKGRTHRLITRGAILESLIENADELTYEEIKILLEEATKTKEFKETLRIMREN